MYIHLKDEVYYNEFYDRFTIEECKRHEPETDTDESVLSKEGDPNVVNYPVGL